MKFDSFLNATELSEAEYPQMLYFAELVEFYGIASDKEIAELEKALKNDDFNEFKKILMKKGLLKNKALHNIK